MTGRAQRLPRLLHASFGRWGLDRGTRAHCRALAQELEIPAPFDLEALCRVVSERRGHPVVARACDSLPRGINGRVWLYDDCDVIEYAAATTVLRERHIACHEIAHLLIDDPRGRLNRQAAFPGWDLERNRVLCRGDAEDADHDPAVEYLAECMMLKSLRQDAELAARTPVPEAAAALAAQLERCLDRPRDGA
jgi:hypothetical protein